MNEGILNQINLGIGNDAQVAGFDGGAHSFAKGARITDAGLNHAQNTVGIAPTAYRGLGKDVTACSNDWKCILERSGLNWKIVPMPLAIQGLKDKGQYRLFPGMSALVRSDNGEPLAVATTDYKPHQNDHMIGTMCEFANQSGLTISRVGTFDGGKRGWVVATSGVTKEAKVGDVVAMRIVLKFGHAPGTATTFQAWAEELRCSNSATIEVAGGKARFVHSKELDPKRIEQARLFVAAAAEAFGQHVDVLHRLRTIPTNKGIDLLMLAQLFQPELAVKIRTKLHDTAHAQYPAELSKEDQSVVGRQYIEQLLESDRAVYNTAALVQREGDRLLNQVIESTVKQPGGNMTAGTMAHAYSGVTNYNSNVRGRAAETGLEANLFGTYQSDSRKALDMAVRVADVVERMGAHVA